MHLSEAEIQVLASLKEAETNHQATDRQTLEKRGKRYGIYKENWSTAFSSLIDKDLLRDNGARYQLSESGRPLAESYYSERADDAWYHYQRLYPVAHASEAHSRFCERLYGKDLCQDGQADMNCIDDILIRLDLKPGDQVLDLGCGAGGLAEYLSDCTGALVTGIDNSASGIEIANARTKGKRDRLKYIRADLQSLDLPGDSFDAAISIDSINFVADKVGAISFIVKSIKPSGQICILVELTKYKEEPLEVLSIDKTPVAQALSVLGLDYETKDYTESFLGFWPLAKVTAESLRQDFVRDGAEFICDNWIYWADTEYLPAIEADEIRRYLYHIRV